MTEKNLLRVSICFYLFGFIYITYSLFRGQIVAGHDIAAHITYVKLFDQAFEQGQFPVRWVEWIENGFSFPLFNFYQVGFYYLVEYFHLLFQTSLLLSIKIVLLLLWILGGLGMYLWMRRFSQWSGLLSSLVFTFSNYLILDIYVRAAYPEFSALMIVPLLFYCLDRTLTSTKRIYGLGLGICLGLVTISHLPMLIIITPVMGLYALMLIISEFNWQRLLNLSLGVILGLGLSAFYILPVVFESQYINLSALTEESYNFRQHFVYLQQFFSFNWGYGISDWGDQDQISFSFGILGWVSIILGIGVLIYRRIKKQVIKEAKWVFFWLMVILMAMFFMTEASLAFWENFTPLQYIQYPWRYLSLVAIASSAIMGLVVVGLRLSVKGCFGVLGGIVGLVIFFQFPLLTPSIYLPREYFNIDSESWRESEGVKKYVRQEVGYLPLGVRELPSKPVNTWDKLGDIVVEVVAIKYHYAKFVTEGESGKIRLNSHYFPGWKAYINQTEVPIQIADNTRYLILDLPAGRNIVEYRFEDTWVRKLGNIISSLSVVMILVLGVLTFTNRKFIQINVFNR